MRQADIVVYGSDGRIQLVVEVKGLAGRDAAWAREMRRNLLGFSTLPSAPYFLLALPDVFYLWKQEEPLAEDAAPSYEIDARESLAPYTKAFINSLDSLSSSSLELLVASWLQDLVSRSPSRDGAAREPRWFVESGLRDAIRGGTVSVEVAV